MSLTIKMERKGNLKNTSKFLRILQEKLWLKNLNKYGEMGVKALEIATPKDSGLTAKSWFYQIDDDGKTLTISWHNSNVKKGYFNVALMLQYGHGTKSGTWVNGVDYINPAMDPVFKDIEAGIWKEIAQA